MSKLAECCGFKCHMCAAYIKNHHGEAGRIEAAGKWKYYFNYEMSPDKMDCPGCRALEGTNDGMIHSDCRYRKCVMEKGVSPCTACDNYSCETLSNYHRLYKEAYLSMTDRILPGDEDGYFLTYIPDDLSVEEEENA